MAQGPWPDAQADGQEAQVRVAGKGHSLKEKRTNDTQLDLEGAGGRPYLQRITIQGLTCCRRRGTIRACCKEIHLSVLLPAVAVLALLWFAIPRWSRK